MASDAERQSGQVPIEYRHHSFWVNWYTKTRGRPVRRTWFIQDTSRHFTGGLVPPGLFCKGCHGFDCPVPP